MITIYYANNDQLALNMLNPISKVIKSKSGGENEHKRIYTA